MITAYLRPDGAEMIEIDTAVYVAKGAAVRLGLAPKLAGTAPKRTRRAPPETAAAPGHTDLMVSPEAIDEALAAAPPPPLVADPSPGLARTARILLGLGASVGEAAATSGLTVDQVRVISRAMRGR